MKKVRCINRDLNKLANGVGAIDSIESIIRRKILSNVVVSKLHLKREMQDRSGYFLHRCNQR